MRQTLKRHELLKRLDNVVEMSDEEMAKNVEWIRDVAQSAYSHIKQRESTMRNVRPKVKK
ncbi:hypothetical protein NKT34_08685 [Paenibacillus polysaccharolyticus]|uniref:hypothetical protein n=1 Tax=Paenibacillus polysaccharolyticus TaxID=582692 RepID=UPI00209DB255|nr:hypothetical protein [Paenibacillus polysaccharolyticus]MCP1133364.1 hypothetical protein [Paenibacillus polysaccharolyticus]